MKFSNVNAKGIISAAAGLVLLISILVIAGAGYTVVHNARQSQPQPSTKAPIAADEPLQPPADVPAPTPLPPTSPSPIPAPYRSAHDYTIPPVTDGLAPVISRLPTKRPVVFLGIDDGANKQDFELQIMKDNHVKASLFLANEFIHGNPGFFKGFVTAGSRIENHTINHKLMSQLSYEDQKEEICGQADLEAKYYGHRPILFRPPGGDYNTDTQRAAADCGMKAVVLWIAKANGGSMQYQLGHGLKPGDIVLMHFRPEFKQDMQAFLDAQNAAGLHTELLEDWLPTPAT